MSTLKGHWRLFEALESATCPISRQTAFEEAVNVLTHKFALYCSSIGLVVMVTIASIYGDAIHIVAISAFCVFLTLLFLASTMYHNADHLPRKRMYRVLDHIAIFLVIAGTYTPFMLVIHDYPLAWPFFWIMWGAAFIGVILKIFFTGRFKALSTIAYLAMGWMGVFVMGPLYETLSMLGFALLAGGGIAYTLGAIFYMWDGLPCNHAVWHLFVMAGSTCHYFSVMTIAVG